MSGGHFDYKQYDLRYMAESIQSIIDRNGKEKDKDERWHDDSWYEQYPEDKYHFKYPDEIIEKFKEGVDLLKKAEVYTQRIDWLLSGDDGEETFLRRLKEDLTKI